MENNAYLRPCWEYNPIERIKEVYKRFGIDTHPYGTCSDICENYIIWQADPLSKEEREHLKIHLFDGIDGIKYLGTWNKNIGGGIYADYDMFRMLPVGKKTCDDKESEGK